jgi:hypothetical protein
VEAFDHHDHEDRLANHLTSEFAPRSLGSFDRDELQSLLDRKGQALSFSVVDHLRWDLKQIFDTWRFQRDI